MMLDVDCEFLIASSMQLQCRGPSRIMVLWGYISTMTVAVATCELQRRITTIRPGGARSNSPGAVGRWLTVDTTYSSPFPQGRRLEATLDVIGIDAKSLCPDMLVFHSCSMPKRSSHSSCKVQVRETSLDVAELLKKLIPAADTSDKVPCQNF